MTIGSSLMPKSALGRFVVALLEQPLQPEQEDWRGDDSPSSELAAAFRSSEMKRADFQSTKPRHGSRMHATAIHCMSIHCIKIHCIKNHGISGTYRFEEQTRRGMTCVCSSKKPPNCWIYFKTRSNHKPDRIASQTESQILSVIHLQR